MEDLELVFPTIEYKIKVAEMLKEAKENDFDSKDIFAGYSSLEKYEEYEEWLQKLKEDLDYANIKKDRIPASTYFLVKKKEDNILGIINIRHYLNEYLEKYGGHIGYSIRYSERRKGYGKKQLKLALEKCRELSIERVLVTCREGNVASEKTIISCGGSLENILYNEKDKDNYKRFWINI